MFCLLRQTKKHKQGRKGYGKSQTNNHIRDYFN
jgi:hypothetical protein